MILTRHFRYRAGVLFKEIIVNCPIGKVKYYAIQKHFKFEIALYECISLILWFRNSLVLTKLRITLMNILDAFHKLVT